MLEPTLNQPKSKVRFLHFEGLKLFATDLGLGLLYVTDIETAKTRLLFEFEYLKKIYLLRKSVFFKKKINNFYRVVSCGDRLKTAMGVAVDPAGEHLNKIRILNIFIFIVFLFREHPGCEPEQRQGGALQPPRVLRQIAEHSKARGMAKKTMFLFYIREYFKKN